MGSVLGLGQVGRVKHFTLNFHSLPLCIAQEQGLLWSFEFLVIYCL